MISVLTALDEGGADIRIEDFQVRMLESAGPMRTA
jgi:hypothetical protein